MENIQEKINSLLEDVKQVRDKHERVRLLEKALEYIQLLGDIDQEVAVRINLLYYSNDARHIDKMMLHFSWFIAYCDKEGERLEDGKLRSLLDSYQRIFRRIHSLHYVTKEQIEMMSEDFLRRQKECNPEKMTEAYYATWVSFCKIGEMEKAREMYDRWFPKFDKNSLLGLGDCPSCALNNEVIALFLTLQIDEAIKKGEALINDPDIFFCGVVPDETQTLLAEAYLHVNNREKSDFHFEAAMKSAKPDSNFMVAHIYRNNFVEAIEMLETLINKQGYDNSHALALENYHCAYLLFSRMKTEGMNEEVIIKLPEDVKICNEKNRYTLTELIDYFKTRSHELIEKFDIRNKNTYKSDFYSLREKLFEPGIRLN